jgi:hypothetical protein
MSALTRAPLTWRSATTYADLCELTARWLERDIPEHPGYGEPGAETGPDPETEPLVPTLAALNRAGFLTIGSQPGHEPTVGWDLSVYEQRAAVELLLDRKHLDVLAVDLVTDCLCGTLGVAVRTKLIGTTHDPVARRCHECHPGIEVTKRDDEPVTCFGGHLPMVERRLMFRGCRRSRRAWRGLYQVALVDPVWWGRNNVLWPWLERLTEAAR